MVRIDPDKATLVAMFFMHLKDDARFNGLIFIGSLTANVSDIFAYSTSHGAERGSADSVLGA